MNINQRLRDMRVSADLAQGELAELLGTNLHWVSKRETGETRALHPDDLAEWAEACGYVMDLAFVRPGTTVRRTERAPEAVEAAELLLEAWDHMDAAARRMMIAVLKAAAQTTP